MFHLTHLLNAHDEGRLHTVAPDADDGHGEADGGDGGLDHLVLDESLDLAADVLAVDFLVQLLVAAGAALVAVGLGAEDLVAGLHAAGGPLVLAGLGESGLPLGGGGGGRGGSRGGRAEEGRCDVVG